MATPTYGTPPSFPDTNSLDSKTLIAHAVALYQAGNLAQAEAIYRQLLAAWPGHPQVN